MILSKNLRGVYQKTGMRVESGLLINRALYAWMYVWVRPPEWYEVLTKMKSELTLGSPGRWQLVLFKLFIFGLISSSSFFQSLGYPFQGALIDYFILFPFRIFAFRTPMMMAVSCDLHWRAIKIINFLICALSRWCIYYRNAYIEHLFLFQLIYVLVYYKSVTYEVPIIFPSSLTYINA